ncbi:DUF2975 domain-containing protein, partial [Bacillus smithii]|uniref:DUF2975 domain-containing protein n=1 Tax=Bacillus smithii TaxID=1479 RepID=UPI002E1A1227|nr:DUF2975 domain-containing protein [Bacillus smithii]
VLYQGDFFLSNLKFPHYRNAPFGILQFIIIFASLVIAVFAAILQRLLQEAINIKSENDLTV